MGLLVHSSHKIKIIGDKMEINLLDIIGLVVFGFIFGGFYYFIKKD